MSFKELTLKTSYETGIDDLVEDFYIPILSQTKRYDRIAGFFSSTSLALSARGIVSLIEKHGKMRLITCPKLSKEDVEAIDRAISDPDRIISDRLINDLVIEDDFQNDHVAALGWMLANGYLEMKIALVYENGHLVDDNNALFRSIMHQKVGILYDSNFDSISFSGSNNESASGWLNNIEEFKVFKQWIPGQSDYFDSDRNKFERFWANDHPSVKVVDLPTAFRDNLIERSTDFNIESISLKKYKEKKNKICNYKKKPKRKLTPFFYQQEAVDKWLSSGNSMLLELATGCGKTITAICCMDYLLRNTSRSMLTVIACPGNTLSKQWIDVIDSVDIPVEKVIICDGTNTGWNIQLKKLLNQLSSGYYKNVTVFTTHVTACNSKFTEIIDNLPNAVETLLIADEVHGMGATKTSRGLLDRYQNRLGLSATPSRWFDDYGTELLSSYFGNSAYQFSIHQAQTTINPATGKPFLVNYFYHPRFVSMTEDELEKYKKLSERIVRMRSANNEEKQKRLEFLLFQRADIEKNAENKYSELQNILDQIGPDISDTIIFVSDDQIKTVMRMLGERKISAHQFTEKESTSPSKEYGGISEREHLIKLFKNGSYKVLVAIKCLDEGIDIPSASRAIVMASSTNPREYIQRIGRIIRQSEDKTQAEIFDLILKPDVSRFESAQFRDMEAKIFDKEMNRVIELSENALNNIEVLNTVYKIKGEII